MVEFLKTFAEVDLLAIDQNQLSWALDHYDVFWFRLGFQVGEAVLKPGSRCRVLATPVTGIDHIDETYCKEIGVAILCLRGERAFLREVRATAELAIGLAMQVMRNITPAVNSVLAGQWNRDLFRGYELYKKTLGIIGFGRLGSIVADYAQVFGMEVIAYEIRQEVIDQHKEVNFVNNLETLANLADLISLHVNYNESNHHLIDESFFRNCKPTSFFVNTSRGGLVDESALLRALKEGWIRGAALDVLQGESHFNLDNPLVQFAQTHTNLIIVPHIGGNTYESFEKTEQFIADKVRLYWEKNERIH